ncbi:Uncharacterised protein [Escherichia coli]|nr:Uncharacterised protein [Escherichia coli]
MSAWGSCQAGIAVFNTDPDKLLETCADINRSVSQTMQVVWETVAQLDAYKVMQPAYSRNTFRALQLNASQMGLHPCSLNPIQVFLSGS